MNLFTLTFFCKNPTKGIAGSDFENMEQQVKINLDFLLSLSDIQPFVLPFSRQHVGNYAIVTMSNNDIYYIREKYYYKLNDFLAKSFESASSSLP